MTSHRPSRWLGPLALLAAVAAVLFVYSTSTQDGEKGDDATVTTAQQRGESRGKGTSTGGDGETSTGERTTTAPQRRRYTVRPGDTLAAIAERTGVSVEELQELNPRLDPNSLTVGDKIKLAE
jgi:LysM repeat protein